MKKKCWCGVFLNDHTLTFTVCRTCWRLSVWAAIASNWKALRSLLSSPDRPHNAKPRCFPRSEAVLQTRDFGQRLRVFCDCLLVGEGSLCAFGVLEPNKIKTILRWNLRNVETFSASSTSSAFHFWIYRAHAAFGFGANWASLQTFTVWSALWSL